MSYPGLMMSYLGLMMSYLGLMMSHLGLMMSYLGLMMSYLGLMMSYLGLMMSYLELSMVNDELSRVNDELSRVNDELSMVHDELSIPYAPCMRYLPTWLGNFLMVNVGKYSIHVEHMEWLMTSYSLVIFHNLLLNIAHENALICLLKVVDRSIAFCMFTRGYQSHRIHAAGIFTNMCPINDPVL